MRQVHQLLASVAYGDAISNEAFVIRDHLRRAGYASDIFAEEREVRLSQEVRPLAEYEEIVGQGSLCLFHFSIGSRASRVAFHARDPLALVYHNITPAAAFAGFHPHLTRLCHEGRRELQAFAPRTTLGLADSEFNRQELEAAGFARTEVLPVVLDVAGYGRPGSPVVTRLYPRDRRNILFVGRIIPSKRVEDLLRAFAFFQKHVDRRSRLLIVGDYRGHERYFSRLLELQQRLNLRDVVFTGRVENDELRSYYRLADLFLCLSAHEGFCVPIVEAMLYGVPVVARDAGAVRDTLGGGGILLDAPPPDVVAETMGAVLQDAPLRRRILENQERSVARFRDLDFGALLLERLRPLLNGNDATEAQRAPR